GVAVMAGGGVAGLGGGAAAGVALAILLRLGLAKLSKNQLERYYVPLNQNLADADGLTAYCRQQIDARLSEERRRIARSRTADLNRPEANHAKAIGTAEANRDERLRKINEVYATNMVNIQTTQQRDLRDAIDSHDRLMADLQAQSEAKFRKREE